MRLNRAEWAVLAFNAAYIAGFLIFFALIANREFIGYIITMLALIALVALVHRAVRFPPWILWGMSLWGVAHMAGGGIPVNGSVLYNLTLVPIAGSGELRIFKYDQAVHFYGFAMTALLLRHALLSLYPVLRGSLALPIFAGLASMGLGAANEIVEFTAVLLVPNTNVGGYYNTGLDLVFNGLGAVTAMIIATRLAGRAQN